MVSYGISINLVEVTWKSKIKAQFPNPNDYSMFMGNFSTATGTVTFAMMLLSRVIFKKFGWGTAALITPTLLLITGLIFFSLLMFPDATGPLLATWGMTPLYAAVLVGAAQNIFSKSAKYSLFDPCKEMAYIPLDDEVKTKVCAGLARLSHFAKGAWLPCFPVPCVIIWLVRAQLTSCDAHLSGIQFQACWWHCWRSCVCCMEVVDGKPREEMPIDLSRTAVVPVPIGERASVSEAWQPTKKHGPRVGALLQGHVARC